MPSIIIHDRDLLYDTDERDVWVNIVGEFRRLDGITGDELVEELVAMTRGVALFSDLHVSLTCVLDTTPARELRRMADNILRRHGASAEVEWSYEIAPQLVERLGVPAPRDRTRRATVRDVLAGLRRRR